MRWVIFAGRFQPFHVGHFDVTAAAVSTLRQDDVLVLAAIAPGVPIKDPLNKEFTKAAEEHHRPERNPWPLPIRLLALTSVANHFRGLYPHSAIIVSAVPRPDYELHTLQSWFPGERIWVIPEAKEEFDHAKMRFFEMNGEQVVRRTDPTNVSGRELRRLWELGKVEEMKIHIPPCVHAAYLMWRDSHEGARELGE
jgi:hypothetical protein